MTEPTPRQRLAGPAEIDITVPHAARVYDYMLGGVTNFEVDREAAEQAAQPKAYETEITIKPLATPAATTALSNRSAKRPMVI